MIKVGDTVRIKTGAYAAFTGKVEEVSPADGTLGVSVIGLFREVSIRLPPEAVEKVAFTEDSSDHQTHETD